MDNLSKLVHWLHQLQTESWRVVLEDQDAEALTVTVKVLYDKVEDGVEKTLQATFTVRWISEHIWAVEVWNSSCTWEVIMEVNPIAAFYLAVGFEFVND